MDLLVLYLPCTSIYNLYCTCKALRKSLTGKKFCLLRQNEYNITKLKENNHALCIAEFVAINRYSTALPSNILRRFESVDRKKRFACVRISDLCNCDPNKKHLQEIKQYATEQYRDWYRMFQYRTNMPKINEHMECLMMLYEAYFISSDDDRVYYDLLDSLIGIISDCDTKRILCLNPIKKIYPKDHKYTAHFYLLAFECGFEIIKTSKDLLICVDDKVKTLYQTQTISGLVTFSCNPRNDQFAVFGFVKFMIETNFETKIRFDRLLLEQILRNDFCDLELMNIFLELYGIAHLDKYIAALKHISDHKLAHWISEERFDNDHVIEHILRCLSAKIFVRLSQKKIIDMQNWSISRIVKKIKSSRFSGDLPCSVFLRRIEKWISAFIELRYDTEDIKKLIYLLCDCRVCLTATDIYHLLLRNGWQKYISTELHHYANKVRK